MSVESSIILVAEVEIHFSKIRRRNPFMTVENHITALLCVEFRLTFNRGGVGQNIPSKCQLLLLVCPKHVYTLRTEPIFR